MVVGRIEFSQFGNPPMIMTEDYNQALSKVGEHFTKNEMPELLLSVTVKDREILHIERNGGLSRLKVNSDEFSEDEIKHVLQNLTADLANYLERIVKGELKISECSHPAKP